MNGSRADAPSQALSRFGFLLVCLWVCLLPMAVFAQERSADRSIVDTYVWIFLVTGPEDANITDAAQRAEIFKGHFENMGRLAEEGSLVLAGPLGEPKSDPLHRGVLVLDVPSVEKARELAATDPGVKSGVFTFRAFSFTTSFPLRKLLELEKKAKGPTMEEISRGAQPRIRPFVLASFDDGEKARPIVESLTRKGKVFFHGFCGGEWKGKLLAVLDAKAPDEARELLEGVELSYALHPWYATPSVQELPGLREID
jgi:uncharacterized protein YciI